ncbi:MAG: ATP-dependent Lon protease [Candidatus Woesearchaeota archaeon]|nr:ATP-dependent Lon protease [Candidatus Woesearchaeota archaeon]
MPKKKKKSSEFNFKTTKEIEVSKKIIDQVIGQEEAVKVIKKAAKQMRHVLLIGEPGTGKSMLGLALAELLPKEKLVDILVFPNPHDENKPLVRTVPAGKGREIVNKSRISAESMSKRNIWIFILLLVIALVAPWWVRAEFGDIMGAATLLGSWFIFGAFMIFMNLNQQRVQNNMSPHLIVDNFDKKQVPFYDATGAHAGALLGDVLHDPFQTGGLGTPAHKRIVAGMIHKANIGVLFIDEIATLDRMTQQELLTALQEGQFPITGQSERSAGAIVRTEPVPCKFVLVAAGNLDTIRDMHPALRSRIRGYGYEIFMSDSLKDTPQNRFKIAQFVAQEVKKDGKIPHFTKDAVEEIVNEARRRSNRKGYLTLLLRDLGGLIRAAGDVALEEKSEYVDRNHVLKAKNLARTLEQQVADDYIEKKKQYEVIMSKGNVVGRVNGLAVLGSGNVYSGILLPIEAEVVAGGKKGDFIATGKLGDIAKEAVVNVSAIVKRLFGKDLKDKYDVYVQFLQTYEGVEGDSASAAVATAVISALTKIPIRQELAMTGSLSVRGDVLPIGGVSAKLEAAIDAGMKKVIVPYSNINDIVLPKDKLKKIKVIPVKNVIDVLENALVWDSKKDVFEKIKKTFMQ